MISLHTFHFLKLLSILQEGAKLYNDLKCFHNKGVHCIREAFKITNCAMSACVVGFSAVQSSLCVGMCAAKLCCLHRFKLRSAWNNINNAKYLYICILSKQTLCSAFFPMLFMCSTGAQWMLRSSDCNWSSRAAALYRSLLQLWKVPITIYTAATTARRQSA